MITPLLASLLGVYDFRLDVTVNVDCFEVCICFSFGFVIELVGCVGVVLSVHVELVGFKQSFRYCILV